MNLEKARLQPEISIIIRHLSEQKSIVPPFPLPSEEITKYGALIGKESGLTFLDVRDVKGILTFKFELIEDTTLSIRQITDTLNKMISKSLEVMTLIGIEATHFQDSKEYILKVEPN